MLTIVYTLEYIIENNNNFKGLNPLSTVVIKRDERKEALKNRERRKKKFGGLRHDRDKKKVKKVPERFTGKVPVVTKRVDTFKASEPTPTLLAGRDSKVRVRTVVAGSQTLETVREEGGYTTQKLTVGRPRTRIVDVTQGGKSVLTLGEREELQDRLLPRRKSTGERVRLTPTKSDTKVIGAGVFSTPSLASANSAFEVKREELETERLGLQARGTLTGKVKAVSLLAETGLRGATIIEKGLIFGEEFARSTVTGKGSPFRQARVKASLADLQSTVIPSGEQISSNPFLAIPATAAVAFQAGAFSTALSKQPPRLTLTTTKTGSVTSITQKGKQATFVSKELFKGKVSQAPPPTGFRTEFFKPKTLLKFQGETLSRGGAFGTGKISRTTSETFLRVGRGDQVLLQQSKGLASDTRFGQRSQFFNLKSGKPTFAQTEVGTKILVSDKTGLFKVGSRSITASRQGLGVSSGSLREQFAVTVKGTRSSFATSEKFGTSFSTKGVASLGKKGQLTSLQRPAPISKPVSASNLIGRFSVPQGTSLAQTGLQGLLPKTGGASTLFALPPVSTQSTKSRISSRLINVPNSIISSRLTTSPTTRLIAKPISKTSTGLESKIISRTGTATITTPMTRIITSPITNPPFTPPTTTPSFTPTRALPFLPFKNDLLQLKKKKKKGALNVFGGVSSFKFTPTLIGSEFNVGRRGGTVFSGVGRRRF